MLGINLFIPRSRKEIYIFPSHKDEAARNPLSIPRLPLAAVRRAAGKIRCRRFLARGQIVPRAAWHGRDTSSGRPRGSVGAVKQPSAGRTSAPPPAHRSIPRGDALRSRARSARNATVPGNPTPSPAAARPSPPAATLPSASPRPTRGIRGAGIRSPRPRPDCLRAAASIRCWRATKSGSPARPPLSHATAGSVCTMSPNELGLSTSSVRGGLDLQASISQSPTGPRAAWATRRRESFSAPCGCRIPAAAAR